MENNKNKKFKEILETITIDDIVGGYVGKVKR